MCADIHTCRKKKLGHARPLRRESLARLRRQPAAVDAEVQVEEGVAALDPRGARVELRREHARDPVVDEAPRVPEVHVADNRLRGAQAPPRGCLDADRPTILKQNLPHRP